MKKIILLLAIATTLSTTFSCTPTSLADSETEQATDGEKGDTEDKPNGDD